MWEQGEDNLGLWSVFEKHDQNRNPAENLKIMGPAEAPVPRLKNEFRYQFLIKAANRKALNELLQQIRAFAIQRKWGATALVIDVDPLTLM